jgi:putative membrane protein
MQRQSFSFLTACLAAAALVLTAFVQSALAQTPSGTTPKGTTRADVPDTASPAPVTNKNAPTAPTPGSVLGGATDEKFIETMAKGGLMEVEAGKLASERAAHPEVKKFGQTMVADHSKSNQKLKALADTRKLDLPTTLDADKKAEKAKLEAQIGPAFDAAYMDAMVTAHQKTVHLLNEQIQTGKDATVRHFAIETLPTVKHHLEMAQQLQAKVSPTTESRAAR